MRDKIAKIIVKHCIKNGIEMFPNPVADEIMQLIKHETEMKDRMFDGIHSAMTDKAAIATKALVEISHGQMCEGPGCIYCEGEPDRHPSTTEARIAKDALKKLSA